MRLQRRLCLPNHLPMRVLTDEQELAVGRREGSLLLAAGAGSGKTSVLVERFVRAVREDGLAPTQILAITFTERAAGELRERVRTRLLELGERDAARETEAAFVSTFHSFCARLLRIHPLQAGVEPGFEILEEGLADRLRMLAFSDALAGFLDGERAEAVDLVAAYGADPLRVMVVSAYVQLRSQGQDEPRLPTARSSGLEPSEEASEAAIRASELIGELLQRFGDAYMRRKDVRAGLDFDDLELMAGRLLEQNRTVRQTWVERFQLLMVDEFQDSNPRQLRVLAALDRDNLFTVGDQLQSIYGFRHADVGLFRERHAELDERGASLALTRNFRSLPPILAAVERIFAKRIGERFTALTPTHITPVEDEPIVELLLTDRRGWERFPGDDELEGLPEATPWRQAEARLLARRVADLIANDQARAGEIVVLMRALSDMPVYESALRRQGLPTLASVGGFWSHQQVGDLLAWLRTLANPLDELALYSTLASPLVGLSSDGLATIARVARKRGRGVWPAISIGAEGLGGVGRTDGAEALDGGGESGSIERLENLLSPADYKRVEGFRELFTVERANVALHPISELLRRAIAATGYEAHVLSLNWGERRLANVHKLLRLARRFEADEGRDLRGFLDHVAHVQSTLGAREADAPTGDDEVDAVRLMSIHAAKGLEFPVVCVADLGREPNLRAGDLLVDGVGGRVGLRLLSLGDSEPCAALAYEQLREERRGAQEEEEDRVLYVACTRAEKRLLLSGSVAFERWPAPRAGVAPIAWLAPALVPDSPKLAASEECPSRALNIEVGGGLRVRCVLHSPKHADEALPDRAAPVEEPAWRSASAPAAQLSLAIDDVSGPAIGPITPRIRPLIQIPAPLADPDGTMSYTSLVELERCGYRYYLERVLGLSENHAAARSEREDSGGIAARARGRIVPMLLEAIDFARPRAPSAQMVAAAARQVGRRLSGDEREEITSLIAVALAAGPARLLGAARRVRREHPFAFSLEPAEPLVTGVLDLIVEQPDGSSLIVDYKSDRLSGGEDLELVVQRDYDVQRSLYALAAIEAGAPSVEVAHWFLERPENWTVARFVADERDRLHEQLRARVARARATGFTVTEAPHRGICLTCPGRGGLCSWGETRTMSERSATLDFER